MRAVWICFCLATINLYSQEAPLDTAESTGEVEFPSEFTTKKGDVLQDCKVKRVESDALIVEHKLGIAKISFFDVSEELQKKHGFDPVAAMEKYHRDKKIQKELRWKRFWDAQKHESEVATQESREKFLENVKNSWTPVEAQVHKVTEEGDYVTARKITFVKTKTKSSLGFEIDGPPRKTLVRISPNVIFIKASGVRGDYWEGYIEPSAHGSVPFSMIDQVPSYHAVARTDFK